MSRRQQRLQAQFDKWAWAFALEMPSLSAEERAAKWSQLGEWRQRLRPSRRQLAREFEAS